MSTKIRKSIGHDRMTFKATFINGDEINFNISRSSDRFKVKQPASAEQITRADLQKIVNWSKNKDGEDHLQRYERFEESCKKSQSLESLVMLVEIMSEKATA